MERDEFREGQALELQRQAMTYQGQLYTAYDLLPEIDDAVGEVEHNLQACGESVTAETIVDILNDFGTRPDGMTDDQWDEMVWAFACEETGQSYWPLYLPDPDFWGRITRRYARYLNASVRA